MTSKTDRILDMLGESRDGITFFDGAGNPIKFNLQGCVPLDDECYILLQEADTEEENRIVFRAEICEGEEAGKGDLSLDPVEDHEIIERVIKAYYHHFITNSR